MSDDREISSIIGLFFSIIIFLLFCSIYQFNVSISELTIGTIFFSLLWMILLDFIILLIIIVIGVMIS